jgi:hypothetical protein
LKTACFKAFVTGTNVGSKLNNVHLFQNLHDNTDTSAYAYGQGAFIMLKNTTKGLIR